MMLRAGDHPVTLRLNRSSLTSEDVDFALRHLTQARILEIDEIYCSHDKITGTLEPADLSQKVLPVLQELLLHSENSPKQLQLLTSDVWELPPATTPALRLDVRIVSDLHDDGLVDTMHRQQRCLCEHESALARSVRLYRWNAPCRMEVSPSLRTTHEAHSILC